MNAGKEIVIISHWFGHSPHCLECVLPYFLERGWQVYHLTDKPDAATKYFAECGLPDNEKIRHLRIVEVQPRKATRRSDAQLRRVEAHWEGVRLALEKLYSELGRKVGVFHTWVDLYSHEYLKRRVIAQAMPAPWCGLYVHPAELRIQKTWKRRAFENAMDLLKMGRIFPSRFKAFNVPNACKIYFLDEAMPEKAARYFESKIELGFFPESTLPLDVPESFRFPEVQEFCRRGRPVLGLLGFLGKRKGLLTISRVAKMGAGDWSFLFAGKVNWDDFTPEEKDEVQDFIETPPSNSLFIPRSLSELEFNYVLNYSSVLYIAYENFFHSSGIQLKATCLKKPMIAGPRHLIAERTRRFRIGWCLPEISTTAVRELMVQIDEQEIQQIVRSAKFDAFLAEHSLEALEKKLEEIADRLGRGEGKIAKGEIK